MEQEGSGQQGQAPLRDFFDGFRRNFERDVGRSKESSKLYKSDVLNELEVDHSSFQNQLLITAFSSAEEYFKIRERLLANILKHELVKIHEMIYNVLTQGLLKHE
jgi:hypothetical protein